VPMGSQTQVFMNLQENINEGLHKDPIDLNIMKQVEEGKMRKFGRTMVSCTLVSASMCLTHLTFGKNS